MSYPGGPDPYQPPPYSPGPYGPVMPYGAAVPAPYGIDPATGLPLSDKSKVAAGLLQLLPGGLLALGGIGRLYAGHTALGVVQLVMTLVGWTSFVCGIFLLFLPWFITAGVWLWFLVDGVVMLAGRPTDGQGRLLRS